MKRLEAARAVLDGAIHAKATPGAQLAVRFPDGVTETLAVGTLAYDDEARVSDETVYDLASITKVFTALSIVRLAHREAFDLTRALDTVLPWTKGTHAGRATLLDLLAHRAGLVHWAPFYRAVSARDAGTDAARRTVLDAVAATPRGDTGTVRYSDLGYVLLGEAIATLAGTSIAAAIDDEVLRPLGLEGRLAYRGVGERWASSVIAPTELCAWRGRVVRGEVHDENAYALGGVCGHAGLFGTAAYLCEFASHVLSSIHGNMDWFASERMAWMIAPRPGGAHRVGWDARGGDSPSSGSRMGPRTFGHLGFTGTSLWCDPDAGVVIALVTNRVHPTRDNQGIRALRPAVHDAVMRYARGSP